MNTDMKELSINEMAQYSGGNGIKYSNPKSTFSKKAFNWFDNTAIPSVKNFGKAVCTVGKAAYNWAAGLFD